MSDQEHDRARYAERLLTYRQTLIATEQTMQSEYDKGVLTLSGGALGLSLAFLKDVVGKESLIHGHYLIAAWAFWGCSIAFVLISYYTSAAALRDAVRQTDDQIVDFTKGASGWKTATAVLNLLSGLGFVAGIALLLAFVSVNLK